jgi:hypothetical protein
VDAVSLLNIQKGSLHPEDDHFHTYSYLFPSTKQYQTRNRKLEVQAVLRDYLSKEEISR